MTLIYLTQEIRLFDLVIHGCGAPSVYVVDETVAGAVHHEEPALSYPIDRYATRSQHQFA